MARRVITDDERALIREMAANGENDSYIAQALGWDKLDLKDPARAVAKVRRQLPKEENEVKQVRAAPALKANNDGDDLLLDQMGRDERYTYLKARAGRIPRYKFVLDQFTAEEQEVFKDEYFRIVRSMESLTEAEEQMLFMATAEWIMAYRKQQMQNNEEQRVKDTMDGKYQKGDDRYLTFVDKRWGVEREQHMKRYTQFMDDLKLSRKQRLDKIKSDKKTLVDVATELASTDAQAQAADEIERLAAMRDDELKRLIQNGYIHGVFSD